MTDPEHSSISSGINMPQWIRSKTERNDIEGPTYSPPSHDDSFFYIRYPVQEKSTSIRKISEKLNQPLSQAAFFSNHTEPCKKFLNESTVDGIKHPPKSFGTDDGFKGPNAACGSSIIEVAQRMVSNRSSTTRGFTVANFENVDADPCLLKTVEDQQLQSRSLIQPEPYELEAEAAKYKRLLIRRGSKSLPSSPLGSPKSMRKYQPNPYFTGTYSLAVNPTGNAEGRGWFLSSLLGIQRDATPSSSAHHIDEEPEHSFNNNNNNNNINLDQLNIDNTKDLHKKILKAKPSELREMNFWSPTSM